MVVGENLTVFLIWREERNRERGGFGVNKTLAEILVCPLSKQPLRVCEKTNSLVSNTVGVSYQIKDGIPCLMPMDGKIIDTHEVSNTNAAGDSSQVKNDVEES